MTTTVGGDDPTLQQEIAGRSYPELLARKDEVIHRLQDIELPEAPPPKRKPPKATTAASSSGGGGGGGGSGSNNKKRSTAAVQRSKSGGPKGGTETRTTSEPPSDDKDEPPLIPYAAKTDTHWDFLMKEMKWLGADFTAERKRQSSLAKKIAAGIKQYHKTKESRRLRELAEAEWKRRRLAGKINREVKGWWTKIERVIAYKQKISADIERRKAMNQQLVQLVKLTERYSESLAQQRESEDDEDDDESSESVDDDEDNGGKRRHSQEKNRMTIEEALQSECNAIRRSKARITDYSRMRLQVGELYGESTASDSGSDASYTPESDTDDETTLREAEQYELSERRKSRASNRIDEDDNQSFLADPEEIKKLQEEVEMEIGEVIERLRNEAATLDSPHQLEAYDYEKLRMSKRVKFVDASEAKDGEDQDEVKQGQSGEVVGFNTRNPELPSEAKQETESKDGRNDPGNDADDDADASDVEDFVEMEVDYHSDESGSEEFEADENDVDDETTMIQEEALPPEMNAQEEIALLKKENEMSVDELRAMYADVVSEHLNNRTPVHLQPEKEEDSSKAKSALSDIALETQESAVVARQGGDDSDSLADSSDVGKNHSVAALLAGSGDDQDDEYQPDDAEVIDDETTIEAEEKLEREMTYDEEIALLKKEGEMSVEELRILYANLYNRSDPESHAEPIGDRAEIKEENREATVKSAEGGLHINPRADLDDDPQGKESHTSFSDQQAEDRNDQEEKFQQNGQKIEVKEDQARNVYTAIFRPQLLD